MDPRFVGGCRRRGAMVAALSALLCACEKRAPAWPLPTFTALLPGRTIAVVWDEAGPAAGLTIPPAVITWLGVESERVDGVTEAWLGTGQVAWARLADSPLFAAAWAECPKGTRRAYADLQQSIDLLLAKARSGTGPAPWAAVQGVLVDRVATALALRGFAWLVAAERTEPGQRAWEAIVATTDPDVGVCGLLAERVADPLAGAWGFEDAAVVATVAFAPNVAVAILRDLLSGDGDGPLQMMRELLRGPRFDAALAAVGALRGSLAAAAAGDGSARVVLGLADPTAVADALDVIGTAAGNGWTFAGWRLAIEGTALVCTRGQIHGAPQPLSVTRPGLWMSAPAIGLEGSVLRGPRAGRVHVQARQVVRAGR